MVGLRPGHVLRCLSGVTIGSGPPGGDRPPTRSSSLRGDEQGEVRDHRDHRLLQGVVARVERDRPADAPQVRSQLRDQLLERGRVAPLGATNQCIHIPWEAGALRKVPWNVRAIFALFLDVLPDPVWLAAPLAAFQFADATFCIKPLWFVEKCLDDVGFPRRYWRVFTPIKAAAGVGLLAGLWVPAIGAIAAACLVVYFVLAVGAHLRARDIGRNLGSAALLLAASALALATFV